MISYTRLINDVYALTSPENETILCSPLKNQVVHVTKEQVEKYQVLIEKKDFYSLPSIFSPDNANTPFSAINTTSPATVFLSLTSACNLKCTYCYSPAVTATSMGAEVEGDVCIALSKWIPIQKDGEFQIHFLGDGETLVAEKQMLRILDHAREVCKQHNVRLVVSMNTNSTLITSKNIGMIKKYFSQLSVSLDGVGDVNDMHRPSKNGVSSFGLVDSALHLLYEHKVNFRIRGTVSRESLRGLPDLLEYLKQYAPLVLQLEILMPVGINGGHTDLSAPEAEEYAQMYTELYKKAVDYKITMSSTFDSRQPKHPFFCSTAQGLHVILPNGDISACSESTTEDSPTYKDFKFGHLTHDGPTYDESVLAELQQYNLYSYPECESCFAKYGCAGGCPAHRIQGLQEHVCNHIREITASLLFLEKANLENGGTTTMLPAYYPVGVTHKFDMPKKSWLSTLFKSECPVKTSIGSIDNNGYFKVPDAPGPLLITVKTKNETKYISTEIIPKDKVISLVSSPEALVGIPLKLVHATVYFLDTDVTWSCDNPNVLINGNSLFAMKEGSYSITGSLKCDPSYQSTFTITTIKDKAPKELCSV